ncbi:CPBP family glutamic-type intramembrane protease [Halobellus marinus]|uniref:CPBP family glutamic-type intramembrane protease n=1 Tax=Halobellus TaxID=1073986 RepID=UPI0028AC2152|nr:CPBP family glutamic-type intramembrane protease [Halobellus sp. DFY28]
MPKALAGLGVLDGVPVLPELGAFGPTVAAFVLVATVAGLAIGLVWAVWHLPLCYIPSQTIYYNIPLFGFFVSTAFLSVLHTWLYNNTNRSLLPALLFHTAFNWANGMFPVLESDPASLTLLVMLAAATVAVVAYWGPSTLSRPRSRSDATV